MYPPGFNAFSLVFFSPQNKKPFFLEQIFECMLTTFFYLSTRFVDVIFFFLNLQSDVQEKNLNYPIKKKKVQRCLGSHHFETWRQGFGKKLEMSGSARSVPSIIYTF